MTTIKITELTNIGANLATSTVIPVVNMSGTPTTQKTVLGNIANVILAGAGNAYVAVGAATVAATVTTNAQPNITSTGNLTGLTVSNAAGTVNFSNTANVTLGAVGNLHIAGGTAGQLLSTNGNGTLSWASDTTTYGNSNVVSLLSSFGSNTITTTGNVSVGNIIGNGQALTNIAGANVSGFVANANIANTAFAVAGANVSGFVANANVSNTAYAVAAANVSGLGNIATINLTGSNSNVLYGNGVFAPAASGGNANTGNVTFSDQVVIGTGSNDGSGGLYLAPGNASIANSAVQYLRVRGGDYPTHIHLDTGNNEYYDQYFGADSRYVKLEANGNIVINADDYYGNSGTWTFDTTGNLTLPGGNSIVRSVANSSLDPLNPNVSTMVLTPDAGYSSQSLVLDPTAPGHIHLRAPSTNIDEPLANIFLGGEDSSFEVGNYNGNVPNLFIHSGGNTWTFGNDGTTTFPTGNITSGTSLQFTTTFANVKTVEYQTAGVWDLYVEDSITGSNTASSRLNVTFKDNLIDKPQVYIENTKESDGIALRWTFDENGNLTVPGNLVIAGNISVFGTDASLLQPANNLPLLSVSSGSNGGVSSLWVEDIGNVGTSNIAAVYANPTPGSGIVRIAVGQNGGNTGPSLWDFGTTGNLTLPTGGHIIVSGGLVSSGASPAPSINGFSITNSVGISGNGNIAGNNISATGNITANNFIGNGNTLSNVATKTTGSWTLASGVNTVNISVPLNGTYAIWINGNIPNGIITYTATAVITNTNVPVLGSQYAWYYAVGNALVLTSIPNQFTGTVGSISNVNTYLGNTANEFTFGITNNSGNTAVVNYGYTKL